MTHLSYFRRRKGVVIDVSQTGTGCQNSCIELLKGGWLEGRLGLHIWQ
jgi:hypothetical protein